MRTYELIGRPADSESVRKDFDAFVAELEARPLETVRVLFGFAWGSKIYEHDWLELELTGAELRTRVAEAEAVGLGKIGADDLFVSWPAVGLEWLYCHEADVHVTARDATHPYFETQRRKWLDSGWDVQQREADR